MTLYGLVALLFVADSTSAKCDKAKMNVSHDNFMAVGLFLFPKQIKLLTRLCNRSTMDSYWKARLQRATALGILDRLSPRLSSGES